MKHLLTGDEIVERAAARRARFRHRLLAVGVMLALAALCGGLAVVLGR